MTNGLFVMSIAAAAVGDTDTDTVSKPAGGFGLMSVVM